MSYHLTLDTLFSKKIEDIEFKTYDFIVIGAGAYGASFVYRMKEKNPNARILILEKGNFLLPEHFQNQKSCYKKTFENSFESPWEVESNQGLYYFGQRPYVGGRALFWNAWTPKPKEFRHWPEEVVKDLKSYWRETQSFMGVSKLNDFFNDRYGLSHELALRIEEKKGQLKTLDPIKNAFELEADLAIKGKSNQWCRFSPVEPLVELINKFSTTIELITNCEVFSVNNAGNDNDSCIESLNTNLGVIYVNNASVIAANGVFEPFITLKDAFPNNDLIGQNLLGHFRSQLLIRVKKSTISHKSKLHNQVAALYLPGKINGREYHIHVSSYSSDNIKANYDYLYKTVPDSTFLPYCLDDNYTYILLQGMSEYFGRLDGKNKNWMKSITNTSKGANGLIHIDLDKDEFNVWNEMDKEIFLLAKILSESAEYQYLDNEDWKEITSISPNIKGDAMMHEGGVFWMGKDSKTSVTDLYGRVHESKNLYVLGSAIFPTIGSYNPTLTGVALTFRLVDHLCQPKK